MMEVKASKDKNDFWVCVENSGMYKKRTRKTPVKRSPWLQAPTLQNFARRDFFNVNEVSIAFSWEMNIKIGESIWKGLITKAL